MYISAQNPGGTAELFQFAGTTEGSSLSTGLLAPNRTYNVYVLNAGNQILGSAVYTMEDVPVFEDGRLKNTSVKITKELRRLDHSTDTRASGGMPQARISSGTCTRRPGAFPPAGTP